MAIIMVAVVDFDFKIGDTDGNLLYDLPKDMKRFKELTINKNIVMGRKTWESLPVQPLPKRKNYVLTSNKDYEIKGRTKLLHSIDEVVEMGKKGDVYVIGGGEIYHQLLEHADKIHLTQVHHQHPWGEVSFPELSPREWAVTIHAKHEVDKKHPVSFTFSEYNRKPANDK